jgi:hypothetical protein
MLTLKILAALNLGGLIYLSFVVFTLNRNLNRLWDFVHGPRGP